MSGKKIKLVVGLGNPGRKYSRTRHNVGWRVVEALVETLEGSFSYVKECENDLAHVGDVVVIKPQTFMNESGRAVRAAMDYYKIAVADVLVVHDDKDLPFGTIRLRFGGSSAGHNGVRSVIEHLGEEFSRVRVGVANAEMAQFADAADFVLGRFTKEEEQRLFGGPAETTNGDTTESIVNAAVAAIQDWRKHGLDASKHRDVTV